MRAVGLRAARGWTAMASSARVPHPGAQAPQPRTDAPACTRKATPPAFLSFLLHSYSRRPKVLPGARAMSSFTGWGRGISFVEEGRYGKPGKGPLEFGFPEDVCCFDDGGIVVTDSENKNVTELTEGGALVRTYLAEGKAKGQEMFHSGICVSSDDESQGSRAGRVLVTDSRQHRVVVMDRDGTFLQVFGGRQGRGDKGELDFPMGIAINVKGEIYVCDYRNRRVQVYSPDGLSSIDMPNLPGGTQAGCPCRIALAPGGEIVVCCEYDGVNKEGIPLLDFCVWVLSGDGRLLIRRLGEGVLASPDGVAVSAGGEIVVIDKGRDCVFVFDSEGRVLAQVGTGRDGVEPFEDPGGVAVSRSGKIVVVERNRIRVLAPVIASKP